MCVLYVGPWYKDCMCFLVCLHIHMVSTVALSICMSVIVSCLVPKVACTWDIAFHFHFLYVLMSCVPSVWPSYCLCHPMQVRQFQCSCVHGSTLCVCPLPPRVGSGTIATYFFLGIDFHVGCLHVSIRLWCVVGWCLLCIPSVLFLSWCPENVSNIIYCRLGHLN